MKKRWTVVTLAGLVIMALTTGVALAAGKAAGEKGLVRCGMDNSGMRAGKPVTCNGGENGYSLENGGQDMRVRAEQCKQETEGECEGECLRTRERVCLRNEECCCEGDGEKQQWRLRSEEGGDESAGTSQGGYAAGRASGDTETAGVSAEPAGCCAGDCDRERDQVRDKDQTRLRLQDGTCGRMK